ncbi:THO complex subunit 5 [Mortierella sp. NVP85]|nr:THO complex subunit 5 [Mortierella sp. NVP85]
MTTNTTVNHYPESVSRLCNELQNLSAQIVEIRKNNGEFASTLKHDDGAMDIDQPERKATVDPQLQQHLAKSVHAGNMLLTLLKNLNRDVYQQERDLKNELTEQKLSVGQVDLGYQNIKYRRKYLLNEISRCHDMQTLYQDIPLVPLEEFRERAPEHLINSSTDEHQLMLNRLQFELEERKRFDAEKRRLLSVKVQLVKANKARRGQINKAEKQLETYIEASRSLQGLFQEPVEPIKTHKELLLADANTAVATGAVSTVTEFFGSETGGIVSSPQAHSGEPVVTSFNHEGESLAEVDTGVVAPIRFGTAELMQRNDMAQLLPQPLYVLFRHACAFSATFGEEVRAEIQGDVQAAQVEARVLAAAQQSAASRSKRDNTVRSGAIINVITVDSPSLQKDNMVDDDEPVVKERRGSDSDSRADSQYERFPLEVVIKIKKDAHTGSHTIAYLRFGYLMRLGIVVVAVEAAPGILKLDPSLILQELFPNDHGEVCPNPEAAFLGLTSYDTLISANGGVGEQGSDLVLDINKAGGYAFRWAQEICGLEFLGPFSQGWGLATGSDMDDPMMEDMGSSSNAVLSGTGNRRAFLSQVIRLVRNRRRAWKALERQLEDLEKGVIPTAKHTKSSESDPPNFKNSTKVTITGWRAVEGGGSKFSTRYSVQFVMPDPLLSSKAVSAKVVLVEGMVEIALAYVDRRPRWQLKPGPGFPESMRTTTTNSSVRPDDVDSMLEESSSQTPRSLSEEDTRDSSPFLDSLVNTVNAELPASLYRAEPNERNMLLTLQISRIISDLSTIMETVSN